MNLWQTFRSRIAVIIGKINWKSKRVMCPEDFVTLRQKLKDNYYVIVSRHNGHLSSYAIAIAHYILTGKWGYYGHVLMNVEDTVTDDSDYRFIEAIGTGVRYADFNLAFDAETSSVALLKPRNMSVEHWTLVLDKVNTQEGKPYDTLFDLANDNALSCVELIRTALRNEPNYEMDFARFENMIASAKNLDPQMFYECEDFEIVWESRH